MVSSSVTACAALRESVSGLRRRTVPFLIESSTEPTIRRSPNSAARLSRKVMTSAKLWPVSMCTSGKGNLPGRKAFSARRSKTTESLPPENSSAGLAHSAATSRRMWMASDSRASRWRALTSPRPKVGATCWVWVTAFMWTGPFLCGACASSGHGFNAYQFAVDHVQAALFRVRVLPPPAAGAHVFARFDGARAGRAAYRWVALVVQGIIGDVVVADVVPDVLLRPVGERIKLGHAVGRIVFLHMQFGARGRLGAALAGDPGLVAGQRAAERFDLADAAAFAAHLDAVVEGVQAVLGDVGVNRLGLRPVQRDLVAVGLLDAVQHRQRFRMQAAGLQREDADIELGFQDQVRQHHVFGFEG